MRVVPHSVRLLKRLTLTVRFAFAKPAQGRLRDARRPIDWCALVAIKRFALAATAGVMLTASLPSAALAQIEAKPFPSFRTSDQANVDVSTGLPFWSISDVSIGPDGMGLQHAIASYKASFTTPQDSMWGGSAYNPSDQCKLLNSGTPFLITYNQSGECFYLQNGVFVGVEARGNVLEYGSGGALIYTVKDGTRLTMSPTIAISQFRNAITEIRRPNGVVTTLYYAFGGTPHNRYRLVSASNNTGFRLYYRYASNDPSQASWYSLTGVTGYNAAFVACDPAQACPVDTSWPTSQYLQQTTASASVTLITDARGTTTRFTSDNNPFPSFARFNRVKLPTSTTDNITYSYCPHAPNCTVVYSLPPNDRPSQTINDLATSATLNGQTWTYGLQSAGSYSLQRNSTSPTGINITLLQANEGWMQWLESPEGRYNFSGDATNRLTSVVWPQGNSTSWTYDARANVIRTLYTPATGSAAPSFSEYATFPATCPNRVTCNRPASLTDANGSTTVFQYDPVHGGVLKATGPVVNGVTFEKRYSYIQRTPRYLSPSGTVTDGSPIWVLDRESFCRTGAASGAGCANPADEVVTVYDYGPTTGVNNLLLRGVVVNANGAVSRTCYGSDRNGNRISETSPNANLTSCP
jgi:YD repeat-containing protein